MQPMMPIGLSDVPGEAMVKLYCPKCMDVYTPKSSRWILEKKMHIASMYRRRVIIMLCSDSCENC